jgi:hypothetical protein
VTAITPDRQPVGGPSDWHWVGQGRKRVWRRWAPKRRPCNLVELMPRLQERLKASA